MGHRVLIVTRHHDEHAPYIAAALELLGCSADLWFMSDFPVRQTQTIDIGSGLNGNDEQAGFRVHRPTGELSLGNYSTVWWRRPHRPAPDLDCLHPDDHEYVDNIAATYMAAIYGLLRDSGGSVSRGLWVNSPEKASAAESKPLQLAVAKQNGFMTPATIVSNDIDDIKSFIRLCGGAVVHKTLAFHSWSSGDCLAPTRATIVTLASLSGELSMRQSPEIFQTVVNKRAEIRVLFFGLSYLAIKYCPQAAKVGIDWRDYHSPLCAQAEATSLPGAVYSACIGMMQDLMIVSASFDIMIDQQGNYIFAELNQAGQFIWLEEFGLPVIQAFADFLVSGDPDFRWRRPDYCLSMRDIEGSQPFKQLLAEESFLFRPPRRREGLSGAPAPIVGV